MQDMDAQPSTSPDPGWGETAFWNVRDYQPGDAVAISQLAGGMTMATGCPAERGNGDESRQSRLWVAESGEQVIGVVEVACADPQVAQLQRLHVKHEWHGRGVGRQLVEAAARHARDRGCLKLVWEPQVVPDWTAEVLDCLGFQYAGERHLSGERLLQFYLDLYRPPKRRNCGSV